MQNDQPISKNNNINIQPEKINQNKPVNNTKNNENLDKAPAIPSVKKRKKLVSLKTIKKPGKTKKTNLKKNYPNLHQPGANTVHNTISPKYLKIFEKIDIFNSCLIMISNVSFLYDYFVKDLTLKRIENCAENVKYCLCNILFLIHKNLWEYNKTSEKNLLKLYNSFIKKYSQDYSYSLTDYTDYCINPDNKSFIITFIYEKLNKELTQTTNINVNLNMNRNNINSINFYDKNSVLSSYLEQFKQNYYSFISDNFIGFYQNETYDLCLNHPNLNCTYSYELYFSFNFELEKISNFYKNNNQNLTLENCFYYYFSKQNTKDDNNLSKCSICGMNSKKKIITKIFSLPNIITITINKYEKNLHSLFKYPDELDLNNYTNNNLNDDIFCLTSVSCQDTVNQEFVCYCFNQRDEFWYLYTKDKIIRCDEINENHIPLIIFYQKKNTINFEYKKIKKNYKVNLLLRFRNDAVKNMKVNQNMSVEDIINKISNETDPLSKINMLLLNSQCLNKKLSISNYKIDDGNIILVI